MAVGAAVDTRGPEGDPWRRDSGRLRRRAAAPGAEMPEATRVVSNLAAQALDGSTRSISAVRRLGQDRRQRKADPESAGARCCPGGLAVTDPEMAASGISLPTNPKVLGLALRAELSEGVRIIHMRPIRRVSSDEFPSWSNPNLRGRRLEPGVLVCLSKDANWFLMMGLLPEHQVAEPPVIQRVQWIERRASRPGRRLARRAEGGPLAANPPDVGECRNSQRGISAD